MDVHPLTKKETKKIIKIARSLPPSLPPKTGPFLLAHDDRRRPAPLSVATTSNEEVPKKERDLEQRVIHFSLSGKVTRVSASVSAYVCMSCACVRKKYIRRVQWTLLMRTLLLRSSTVLRVIREAGFFERARCFIYSSVMHPQIKEKLALYCPMAVLLCGTITEQFFYYTVSPLSYVRVLT